MAAVAERAVGDVAHEQPRRQPEQLGPVGGGRDDDDAGGAAAMGSACCFGGVFTFACERGSPSGDAVSALVNLGYRQSEAYGAVSGAAQNLGEGASIEALIQAGLKELST